MTNASDPTRPNFWSVRYAAGTTPWDFEGVPVALRKFLRRRPHGGRVLIPGCGSGYEVQAFHDAGFDVTAVDFSPVAIERARHLLGPLGARVHRANFFSDKTIRGPYDLIYERTFLCSMPPARWPVYAQRIAHLLAPDGRLVGLFFRRRGRGGPPFPITQAQLGKLFHASFRLTRDEPVSDSLALFKGRERWQEWSRV